MNGDGSRATTAVLFWGGLWGLAEAAVGHGLHLLRVPGLPGWIMFPFGLWVMRQAFRRSGRTLVLAGVPAVAAAVKLADFILPVSDPFVVLNPAAAILPEGIAAAVLLSSTRRRTPAFASLFAAAAGWRAAYLGWCLASAALLRSSNRLGAGASGPWSFLAVDSLMNAALAAAGFEIARRRAADRPAPTIGGRPGRWAAKPAIAAAVVLTAVTAEILLRRG